MRICIYGAGAIGGYLGVQLALAGEDVTLIARGPHLEGHATTRCEAPHRRRGARGPSPLHRRPERRGAAGLRHRHPESPLPARHRRDRAAPARPGNVLRDGGQRGPLVVLLRPRGALARPPARQRRSGWQAVGADRSRARHRLRGLPGHRGDRTRRDPAPRRRPLHPGRTERREDRPCCPFERHASGRGISCTGPLPHPQRHLDQAVGQSEASTRSAP